MKRATQIASAWTAAALLALTAAAPSQAAPSGAPIRIGSTLSLTGPL